MRCSSPGTILAQPRATPTMPLAYEGAMERMRFAVLDVETTEGDPTRGRIMDIAVIALNGTEERLRWDSLVHPRCKVPPFMRKFTGIDDGMLAEAPYFSSAVRTLETLTQDRIIVAHNVRFDMTALAHEFARTGMVFERSTLCTERLARRLLPQLGHYNLASLCRYFGIPLVNAHRALADAEATAELLKRCIECFGADEVMTSVVPLSRALRA